MIRRIVLSPTLRPRRIASRQSVFALRTRSACLLLDTSFLVAERRGWNAPIAKQPVSSLALQAWDMVRSASINPPNPLLEQDVNFERVSPHHLVGAAKQVRREYLEKFEALEEALSNESDSEITPEFLLEKLEELEAPLDYVHNAAALYQSLMQTPDWENAAHQVAVILDQKPHQYSHVIMEGLTRLDEKLEDDDDSSVTAAIRHHLNRFRHRGVKHLEEETLRSLQDSLEEIEARFVKYSDMDNRGTTRQKLEDVSTYTRFNSCHGILNHCNEPPLNPSVDVRHDLDQVSMC